MKLKVVRLAEFATFFDGVELAGLSDGLNVLIGPNERGKSTILRALNLVFGELHTAQNKTVKACRSRRGGAPLVEVEFVAQGEDWRLTKRFLAGKFAELTALSSGQTWRNAEAEDQLASLIAQVSPIPGARGLLWVEQTKSFSIPAGKEHEPLAGSLGAFIRSEAQQVAGGNALQRVRALAKSALGELVTSETRRERKGGPLAAARADRDRYAQDLEKVRSAIAAADARMGELGVLRDRERELQSAERKAQIRAEIEAAEQTIEAVREAREKASASTFKVDAAQAAFDAKSAALTAFQGQINDLARLEAVVGDRRARLAALERDLRSCTEVVVAARRTVTTLIDERLTLEAALRRGEEAERLALLQRDRADVVRRLSGAEAAAQRAEAFSGTLASLTVTADDVVNLRKLAGEIGALRAVLAAAATGVVVRYERGISGGFEVAGQPLEDGVSLVVEEPLVVDVAGVGSLEIMPGRAGELGTAKERLAALEQRHNALTERLGVADLDAAEAALKQRSELERDLQLAHAEVRTSAPGGIGALNENLRSLDDRISSSLVSSGRGEDDLDATSLGQIRPRLDGIIREQTLRQVELDAALAREQALTFDLGKEKVALEIDEAAFGALASRLPEAAVRNGDLRTLHDACEVLRAQLNAAVREREAWREKAVSDEAFAVLSRKRGELIQRRDLETRELQEIAVKISALEARLDAHWAEDDVQANAEAVEEKLVRAQQRVADLEIEVEALGLIEREIAAAEASFQDRVLAPLTLRLSPMVGRILPGAALQIAGPLGLEAIRRGPHLEPMDELSDGTREQLAVLVRLAYAGMFADRGLPLPVILDDALVFSDDVRLREMFLFLHEAGQRHQVLVLTCHERGFLPLVAAFGGRQLELVDWLPGRLSRAG